MVLGAIEDIRTTVRRRTDRVVIDQSYSALNRGYDLASELLNVRA